MQSSSPQLGIRQNLPQFSLLVLINAFVGAMVGIERSVLPLIAEQEFHIASRSTILSFLISFGVVKAFSNVLAGHYADLIGRKKLLVAGWLVAVPIPSLLWWAPSWHWIVAANVLLGINQGLCWSTTVVMKIDLAGPRQRGLAMGLNEFAGYVSVAMAAYAAAVVGASYGFRYALLSLGSGIAVSGLMLSIILVKETREHAVLEAETNASSQTGLSFREVFRLASWRDARLFSCSQAGLVNNLNDGLAWGLFPLFFASLGYSVERIGFLTAVYPATWGILQIMTGALSDRFGRRWMIAAGMWLQGFALLSLALPGSWWSHLFAMVSLGVGTAMVYPTLLATVSDVAHPEWRASAVGVYRWWRDLGYALGALVAGMLADLFGMKQAVVAVGGLTLLSGIVVAMFMKKSV